MLHGIYGSEFHLTGYVVDQVRNRHFNFNRIIIGAEDPTERCSDQETSDHAKGNGEKHFGSKKER